VSSSARRAACLVALGLSLATSAPARAVEPDEVLADPALEARARDISAGLRCLVCQNQSIDDSHAPLARDLRLLVRERLKAGDTDKAVRAYVVDRYGEFVLLRPPVSAGTILLWLTPLVLLGLAGGLAFGLLRGRPAPASVRAETPLTSDEQRRLDELMSGKTGDPRA
jgi:cytochrome c-type biogenesis protein CcmH